MQLRAIFVGAVFLLFLRHRNVSTDSTTMKMYDNNSIVLDHKKVVSAICDGGFVKSEASQKDWLNDLEQGHSLSAYKKPNVIQFSHQLPGKGAFSMRTVHQSNVHLLESKMGMKLPVVPVGQSSMFENNLTVCGQSASKENQKFDVKATAIMVNEKKCYIKDSWNFSVDSKPKRGRDSNMSVVRYSSYWLTKRFNRSKEARTWRTSGCILVISIADKHQKEHSLAFVIAKPMPKKKRVSKLLLFVLILRHSISFNARF